MQIRFNLYFEKIGTNDNFYKKNWKNNLYNLVRIFGKKTKERTHAQKKKG